jgi:hypothetical protein
MTAQHAAHRALCAAQLRGLLWEGLQPRRLPIRSPDLAKPELAKVDLAKVDLAKVNLAELGRAPIWICRQ